jgi:cation transport ATPase
LAAISVLVAAELARSTLRTVEEKLLLTAIVNPIGTPPAVIGMQPHHPAFLTAEIASA